jgi:snRNA-activating protein complex subunit 3
VWFLIISRPCLIVDFGSITDIKSSIEELLDNPTLYAHITKTHDTNVYLIHEHADTSGRRKRRRPALLDPAHEVPAVTALQKTLDTVQLKSWQYVSNLIHLELDADTAIRLMLDSALFMRAPKNSDQNVLTAIKKSVDPSSSSQSEHTSLSRKTALISLTVHNRLSWGHNLLSRSSQHALLASQTLGDLFEAVPCTSNEIPEERLANGEIVGYKTSTAESPETGSSGCVICIEGKAYGDGISENDYAE